MFCSINELRGFSLLVHDGEAGHAREAYFDDQDWAVRHLVADTGQGLGNRLLLIPPQLVRRVDPAQRKLSLAMTRQQFQHAPGIAAHLPVSLQRSHDSPHFTWRGMEPWRWDLPPGVAQALAAPTSRTLVTLDPASKSLAPQPVGAPDPHLRSSAEVIGAVVMARDGAVGTIEDLLFDAHSWRIHCAVVDTHKWLPDRLVLVAPGWISHIDWPEHQVRVKVSREAVKTSPPYTRASPVSVADTERLRQHSARWLATRHAGTASPASPASPARPARPACPAHQARDPHLSAQ